MKFKTLNAIITTQLFKGWSDKEVGLGFGRFQVWA